MTDKAKPVKPAKDPIDWTLIERDFRSGIKPLRQIGEERGVSHTAIKKRADKEGWTRDLQAKIAAKAEDKVSRAAVSKEVSTETKVSETQVVEANAELQYRIRMEHRGDIKRARALFGKLIGEVEEATDRPDLLEELFELLHAEDKKASVDDPKAMMREEERLFKLRQKFEAVISIAGRVDAAKKLSEMLERLVKMEREAFGIKSDEEDKKSSVDELLLKIHREREAKKA